MLLLLDMLMSPMGAMELDIIELVAIDDEDDDPPLIFLCFIGICDMLLLDMLAEDMLGEDMAMPLPMVDWAWVRAGIAAAPAARATAAAIGRNARMVDFLCRVRREGNGMKRGTRM